MKICVIHGSNRKGNTDKSIDIIKQTLNQLDEIIYTDIYLPRDLPSFCEGCFACLRTGEYAGQHCPHKQYTHPILKSFLESDGIIFASPSYALAESAQVKALLDHFACTYINHRPNEEMFDKIGFAVSTAAGAGTGNVIRVISRNMLFWGIKRTVKCRANMWAMNWDEMGEKRRLTIEKRLRKKAAKFFHLTKNRHTIRASCLSKILHLMFARLIKSYADSEPDKIYWKSKGWI
ncbi:flavodoxin family protein [Clostridium aminobutyricum]|uniref:Flavodoxin family protein n=1 Tax=Clostridium aminobutyricum TaxID=33953 RepID=A0A939III6_CLOAM|nr:flavodoxin family protein [Clostridium aminobutyricum]MBN7772588.1 flavodoxin family protein [Clostridium aminobutyricum]